MSSPEVPWPGTTHDWSVHVDDEHLRAIRDHAHVYAAGGAQHLLLEVLAYADDEARDRGRRGTCTLTIHEDGEFSVTDDGRGTDTRRTSTGRVVRKPVMASQDLRFFTTTAQVLPDGLPRRGMSTVAALSSRLEHINHRLEGSWTQTFAYGVPTGPLRELPPTSSTGTTVRFTPDPALVPPTRLDPSLLRQFPAIDVRVMPC